MFAPEPTTKVILNDCPQSRILVIGKSGAGKSTLINNAFGIHKAASADLQRGKADIQIGLESPVNKRFILHDTLGFEPGDKDNYEIVKQFIEERQGGSLKDQLHAIWFCVKAPQAGERLFEVINEDFFRFKKRAMGAVPLVVVFTKFDRLVNERVVYSEVPITGSVDEEGVIARARSEAESIVRAGHDKITQLAGESLPYAVVSTKKGYQYTLQNLIKLTHLQVETSNTSKTWVTR